MSVFHVELRHLDSKWRLWSGTILAETEDEAVAEAKKFVAYADQIPFQVSVTQIAEIVKDGAAIIEEIAPGTAPVDEVVKEAATETEAVAAEEPGRDVKALLEELLRKVGGK